MFLAQSFKKFLKENFQEQQKTKRQSQNDIGEPIAKPPSMLAYEIEIYLKIGF